MAANPKPAVLLVEGDILVRHPLAEYLRDCGFTVFEASNGEEARTALRTAELGITVVVADMATAGAGFALRQWARTNSPSVELVLAGSIEQSVGKAASLCEEGPALAKPYEHHLVLDRIRRVLARRDRCKPA